MSHKITENEIEINTWISIVKVRALNLTKKIHSQS